MLSFSSQFVYAILYSKLNEVLAKYSELGSVFSGIGNDTINHQSVVKNACYTAIQGVLMTERATSDEKDISADPFLDWVTGHYLLAFPWADANEIRAVKAYVALGRAYRAGSNAFGEFLAQYNLTPAHYSVVRLLYVADGKRMAMSDIGKLMSISTTAVTKQIDWLARREWVTREAHPTDRRVTYAQLTGSGEARLNTVIPGVLRFSDELWKDFSVADQEQLIRLLSRFRAHAEGD